MTGALENGHRRHITGRNDRSRCCCTTPTTAMFDELAQKQGAHLFIAV
jgi:hypothetical protein